MSVVDVISEPLIHLVTCPALHHTIHYEATTRQAQDYTTRTCTVAPMYL